MKVFIVMTGYYEQYGFSGAFASMELAEKYIAEMKTTGTEPWMDHAQDSFYHIIEAEVATNISPAAVLAG